MAITKLTTNLNNISALGDSPNTAPDSLTATQMKAKFDKAGGDIKTYLNDVLTVETDTEIATLNSTKVEITPVVLYSGAGIADGATDTTITGISNYHLFAIETDLNTIVFNATINSAKTKINGLGQDITGGVMVTVHLSILLTGDLATFLYIKNITHTASSTHGTVGTAYKVTKIYGIL